ncbi:MAG: GDP-mannose 4,6-dehydratase [Chloroflexi bacterium]|nr:GDP-mannose 4,6-dehydratase [Chloroflexota bacterium]MBU1752044.1 GDP-mannose 4,6-dehydratase [Chloroflexota bacterium]MBU1879253.1 GDP-mannose 4,6-dehydratase [Chloroflexota bacterium]
MHVLITGGAGFIGSHLAEALLAADHRVTVIDDLSTGRFANIEPLVASPQFHFAIETITNETVLDRLASECDFIYHLAAAVGVELIVRSPVHVIQTNILGTEAVLRAANRYRRPVLLASTSEIYGKSEQVPFKEDDDRVLGPTTRSRWCYSTSKAVDEFLALAYHKERGLPVIIARLFNTVGPRQTGQYGMVVPRFVAQAVAQEPITVYGDGQQSRCFTDVEDVVRALLLLAKTPAAMGNVFNIGGIEEVTILELARRVLSLADSTAEVVFIPYEKAYEEGFEDMRRRVPDTSRLRAVTGWQPRVSLDETLHRMIAYAREQTNTP